jgi:hypothetical protein
MTLQIITAIKNDATAISFFEGTRTALSNDTGWGTSLGSG